MRQSFWRRRLLAASASVSLSLLRRYLVLCGMATILPKCRADHQKVFEPSLPHRHTNELPLCTLLDQLSGPTRDTNFNELTLICGNHLHFAKKRWDGVSTSWNLDQKSSCWSLSRRPIVLTNIKMSYLFYLSPLLSVRQLVFYPW